MQKIGDVIPAMGLGTLLGLGLVYLGAAMGINAWLIKGFFDTITIDVPGQGHEQRDGVLGGADGVAAGRVHDHDALAGGRRDVDVVHADAGPHHRPQPARAFEQLRRHARGAADDDAVRGPDRLLERLPGQAVALVQLDAGPAQQVEAGGF